MFSPFREEIINVSGAIKLRVWQSGVWLAFLKCTTLRWIKLESFIYKIFQGSCKSWFKGRSFICYLYLYDAVINILQIIFHTVCLWKHFVYFLKLSNNNFFWLLISRRKGVCAKFTYFEEKKHPLLPAIELNISTYPRTVWPPRAGAGPWAGWPEAVLLSEVEQQHGD